MTRGFVLGVSWETRTPKSKIKDGNVEEMDFFLKNKSDQYEVIEKFLRGLKAREFETKNIDVLVWRKIRLDNAGENKRLEIILKEKGFNLKIKYTPVDGPKYNVVVECAFSTMYGRVRAMLNAGGYFKIIGINFGGNAHRPRRS